MKREGGINRKKTDRKAVAAVFLRTKRSIPKIVRFVKLNGGRLKPATLASLTAFEANSIISTVKIKDRKRR